MRFEDKPDYSYLRHLFRDCIKSRNLENDHVYDWTKKENAKTMPAFDRQEERKMQ